MNILILYHVKEREFIICDMIKEALLKQNGNLEVRIEEFYDTMMQKVWDFQPDIILTIPPRDSHSSNYLTMIKAALQCSIVSLSTEGFFARKTEEQWRAYIGTNDYSEKLIDYYLMWGESTRNEQVSVLRKDKKITDNKRAKVVGYAFYDKEAFHVYSHNLILPQMVKKWIVEYKKHVLCLTGFIPAEYTIEDFIRESWLIYYGVKGKEKEFELEKEKNENIIKAFYIYREKYINNIIQSAEKNPDIGFWVKLHPAELALYDAGTKYQFYHILDKYPNIQLLEESVPMGMLLPYTDLLVHYGSTAGLEAYIYNVPTLHVFDKELSNEDEMPGYCSYMSNKEVDIDDFEQFNSCIEQGVHFDRLETVEEVLYEQFNWRKEQEDYHPAEEIAKYILQSWNERQILEGDKLFKKIARSMEGRRCRKNIWKKVKYYWKQKDYHTSNQYMDRLKRITPNVATIMYDFKYSVKLTLLKMSKK